MDIDKKLNDLLNWYLVAGVDETIGDQPTDRFEILGQKKQTSEEVLPNTTQPKDGGSIIPKNQSDMYHQDKIASSVQSLKELKAELLDFDQCPLKRTATNLVFVDGSINPSVLFIGEAPGAEEDRVGRPFVGPSGRLLDLMLASIGLDRGRVLISNTVFWRPPGNRTPTALEVSSCYPFIEKLIELTLPKLIVALGGPAARTLLNQKVGVSKIRGKWFAFGSPNLKQEIPATVMFHPAYLLRSPDQKKLAWRDMRMIEKKLKELNMR
ncbi:MAG: hypothetical protein CFH06_00081 [Alphaproteobacteria bacterium MarineAlpha3_Bin5]|nr:uracil-DNA glycosylase [Magnetovibrio sp.]PPR80135.1 MAG: hypothetical protein CFH06_00081 [Alphaproteobacteria bacterium MarineAlpha3_Bin5]|tara:strand:+ start:495 stop:1295 length:801 start_codon:yes stop_codon:yes gene_type:complete